MVSRQKFREDSQSVSTPPTLSQGELRRPTFSCKELFLKKNDLRTRRQKFRGVGANAFRFCVTYGFLRKVWEPQSFSPEITVAAVRNELHNAM